MSSKYYTYELAYPEIMGGTVFYVGKGKTEEKPWQKSAKTRFRAIENWSKIPLTMDIHCSIILVDERATSLK